MINLRQLLFPLLLGVMLFCNDRLLPAQESDVFVQTDWSGGVSVQRPAHPSNKTQWTFFSSKDANLVNSVAGLLTLSSRVQSFTHTSASQFSGGIFSGTELKGTGSDAYLTLTPDVPDAFNLIPGQWSSLPETPSLTWWSPWVKAGNYVYALWRDNKLGRYNISTQVWDFMEDMPVHMGPGAAMAYPSSGGDFIYVFRGASTKNFYKYSISANTWVRLQDTPYFVGLGGSAAANASKIFCIAGGNSNRAFSYDIAAGVWSAMANTPVIVGRGASLTYPGTGTDVYAMFSSTGTTLSRYSIAGNAWVGLANAPFGVGTLQYPGTGDYLYAYREDDQWGYFARYNYKTSQWEDLYNGTANASIPIYPYRGILYDPGSGDKLCFLSIGNYARPLHFDPSAVKWDEPMGPRANSWFLYYSQMLSDGGNFIYATSGYYSGEFTRYSVSANNWIGRASLPWAANYYGHDLVYHQGLVYAQQGSGGVAFASYNPLENKWTSLPNILGSISYGGALASDGTYIYGLRGYQTASFWRYDPQAGLWDDSGVADLPSPEYVYYGGDMVYPYAPGQGGYIFASTGYSNGRYNRAFWRYNIEANSWTRVADAPFVFYDRSQLIWPGSGNYIYVVFGTGYSFARYNIDDDTWVVLSSTPFWSDINSPLVGHSGKIYMASAYEKDMGVYDIQSGAWNLRYRDIQSSAYGSVVQVGDTAYRFHGNSSTGIWAYSISQKRWTDLIIAPFMLGWGTKAHYPGTGNYIYVMEGRGETRLWRYDTVNRTWQTMANAPYPVTVESQMDGFGDSIFVAAGVGLHYTNPSSRRFMKYSVSAAEWYTLVDLPAGMPNNHGQGNAFAFNPETNILYWKYGAGSAAFYQYNAGANAWSSLASAPAGSHNGQALLYPGSGDKIYWYSYQNNFCEYSATTNTWRRLAAPSTNYVYTSNDGDMFYPGEGDYIYYFDSAFGRFSRYSLSANAWDQPIGHPSTWSMSYYGVFASGRDEDLLYFGGNTGFWKYSISGRTFTSLASPYSVLSWPWDEWSPALKYGGSGDFLYTTRGRNRSNFARYSITQNTWQALASPPATFGSGHDIAVTSSFVYVLRGDSTNQFWAYDISSNQWISKAVLPGTVNIGGRLVYPGRGDFLYATRGNGTASFYRYSISQDKWSDLADAPVALMATDTNNPALMYPGKGDYIYLLPSANFYYTWGSTTFLRYSISTNTWQELGSSPEIFYGGLNMACPPGSRYLYISRGGSGHFYDILQYRLFQEGSYVSPVLEVGNNSAYDTASWSGNNQGLIEVKVRTALDRSMANASAWANIFPLEQGGKLAKTFPHVQPGHQYLQYELSLLTENPEAPPELRDITFNFLRYPFRQELVSSAYNSTQAQNRLTGISWAETLSAGSDVRFQLRTAPDANGQPGTWSQWLGPAGVQTLTDSFDNDVLYSHDPLVEVSSGVARLVKYFEDYAYTQRIVIDNNTETVYSNQVMEFDLTSANSHFWANVKSDGSDVRFVDGAGNVLSYNLSANGASFNYAAKTARIFVRVLSLPANQKTSIFMKYGKEDAVDASDLNITSLPALGNLMAYYNFDEGSGSTLTDWSGRGNTGAIMNYPLWTEGRAGRALSFNGLNQYVDLGVRSALKMSLPITISYWVNLPAGIDGNWRVPVASTSWGGNPGYNVMLNSNQQFIMTVNGSEVTSPRNNWGISTGVWHMITHTVNSSTSKLYIDGVLRQVFTGSWGLSASPSNTWLGFTPISAYSYFLGSMDEVAIYNKDLSETEVSHLFNGSGYGFLQYYFSTVEDSQNTSSLSGWNYRSAVTIDNTSGGELTNYQVKVNLASGYEGFWSRCREDGADVRFVDADNTTILNYYQLSFDYTGKTAAYWVKVPKVGAGEVRTIYLYYGRADAASTSNINSTMVKDFGDRGKNTSALDLPAIGAKAVVASAPAPSAQLSVEADVKYKSNYWPAGWSYRKLVTIDNTAGAAATNTVVSFDVLNQAEMKADYADIRFWDEDMSRPLKYRIYSADQTKATVHVEIPSLPQKQFKKIYMFYGNSSAESASDPLLGLLYKRDFFDDLGGVSYNYANSVGVSSPELWAGMYATDNPGSSTVWLKDIVDVSTSSEFLVEFLVRGESNAASWHGTTNVILDPTSTAVVHSDWSSSLQNCSGNFLIGFGTPGWGRRLGYDPSYAQGNNLTENTSLPIYLKGSGYIKHKYRFTADKVYLSIESAGGTDTSGQPHTFPEIEFSRTKPNKIILGIQSGFDEKIYLSQVKVYSGTGIPPKLSASFGNQEISSNTLAWLPGFAFRQKVTLDNTGKAAATNSIYSFNVNFIDGKMRADYGDIRFVDTDGKKLSYRIYSSDATKANFIVKVPAVPANSTKDVLMYYGNAELPAVQDNSLITTVTFVYPTYTGWVDNWGTPPRTWDGGAGYRMMGGRNNYGSAAYTQYTVTNLPAGSYTISFDYFKMDSWDGEQARLYANATLIWNHTGGGSGTILSNQSVVYTHPGGDVIFKFTSGLDQAAGDESFGVDKITIPMTGVIISVFGSEESAPTGIDQTLVAKAGAYGLKFTDAGLTGFVNATSVSTGNYASEDWMNAGLTYDGAALRLYVNGVLQASAAASGVVQDSGNPLIIGEGLLGTVDEVRVWSTVRGGGDFYENRFKSLPGNSVGLAGYWSFNENTGATAVDASIYGHNAELSGGAGWLAAPFAYLNGAPAAVWHLDEGAGTASADATGNGNQLTLVAPSWSSEDLTGFSGAKSLMMNGTTTYAYTAASRPGLDMTGQVSIEAWIQPALITGTQVILSKGSDVNARWNYRLSQVNDTLEFAFYNGTLKTHTTSPCLAVGTTAYVVVTFDEAADRVRIYVNGTERLSVAQTASMLVNSDPLYLGREASGANAFSGGLDEVRLYNRILSAYEILRHYEHRLSVLAEPVLYNVYTPAPDAGIGAYSLINPVIQPVFGSFYQNKNLLQMQDIAIKPFGTDVRYQISADGYSWYWYNGTQWISVTGGYLQTNTTAEINAHLADFTEIFPEGNFYYRAYLHSEPYSFRTPSLDTVNASFKETETYYVDASGGEKINTLHTDADSDQWYQYRALLFSEGKQPPVLDDVSLEYITAVLNLLSPNGGETLVVGQTLPVTWTAQALHVEGGAGLVKLQYSPDNGNSWDLIAEHVSNTGSYQWTVPDKPAQQAYLRIVSEDLPTVSDMSDTSFRVLALSVTAPNGGEVLEAGRVFNIRWNVTGTIPNEVVKIEYSLNNGSAWNTVSSITANDGQFEWTVPAAFSDTVLVRITSPSNSRIQDVSDAVFSIVPAPAFTLASPSAGALWSVGAVKPVSWRTNSRVFSPEVLLEYSTDDFTQNIQEIAVVSVGQPQGELNNDDILGTYNWTVPEALSSSMKVRITETEVPAGRGTQQKVSFVSPVFSVVEPVLVMTAPQAEAVWVAGDTDNITWTADGAVSDNLKLEYSLDGQNFVLIAENQPNTGSYAWVIPSEAVGGSVYLRLTDTLRPQVNVLSGAFRVLPHTTIELVQPVGGEHVTMGTSYTIKWTTFGRKLEQGGADYNKLSIYYSSDDGATWTLAAFNQSNTGTYTWFVPDEPTQTARIKVASQSEAQAQGISPQPFVIELPTITLTSPVGGEELFATGNSLITWTSVGSLSNNLKLEYSVDSGSTWHLIASGQPNTGNYLWSSVADQITSSARIRITDAQYPSVIDVSPADFSIRSPSLTLILPNGGEKWVIGTTQDVRWYSTGKEVGAVRDNLTLQYSIDDGSSWNDIASSLADNGLAYWTIPDTVTVKCRVRIFDATRPATQDVSDSSFEISLPKVTITSPNGNELWPVGIQYPITWESLGAVSNDLKLEYSTNNFATVHTIAASVPDSGEYLWTVPDNISDTVRVRLTDNQRPEITDTSDLTFAITLPRIVITWPNGGEIFSAGDTENITWQALGSVGNNLKIEYSKDNFVSDIVPIAQSTTNTGTYAWTVPDDRSAALRVRITDMDRQAVWDKSDANFTILPSPRITVLKPEAGEVWRVGTSHDITWEDNGGKISNNLLVSYSVDNGATWKQIAAGEHNDGQYTWTIPDYICSTAIVRVMDASRPTTVAVSPLFNMALPAITIVAPNGGEVWSVGDRGPVRWTTEGTVSENLLLSYSPDRGTTWTLVRGGIPNSGAYSWTVPDYITTQCLIRFVDGDRPAVLDVSDDVFVINPLPTMTFLTPGSGNEYVLSDTIPITWEWTGLSIANITLDYSSDNFITRRIIETNLANTGSYDWVVPADAITGRTIKFRLTDGVRSQITATSQGNVRIRGGFKILSPNGGEKLVARSTHSITWQTMGTIANVRLEYTTDGVNWSFIGTAVNTGSYNWTTPDIKSTMVRVRVSDVNDNTTMDMSDTVFSLVYATTVFKVMDYDTYQHLTDFSASEPASGWTDSALASPVTRTAEYPYGTYTTFFSKQEYIDNSVTWTPPKLGVEPYVVTIYLENAASAQVTWESILTYSFSPATDSLAAIGSLQRKGKLVGTNEVERSDMGTATFRIYKPDGTTVRNSMASPAPGINGMYNFTLSDSAFEAGKVYPATLTIEYRGREYTSAANIDVGSEIMQYEFFTETTEQLMSAVSNIQSTVQATSDDMKKVVSKDIASIKTELQNETRKILFSTQTELPARIELLQETVQREMSSEILNTESQIKAGETLTIRYRAGSGLLPVIDVYNAQNTQVISAASMTELPGTGIYQYPVTFYSAWGRGDFTIVCSESTMGTIDAMTITVMQSDVDQVYSQVSSLLGTTSGISGISTTVNKLSEQFTSIETMLNDISSGKGAGSAVTDAAKSAVAPLFGQLTAMSKQIQSLVGDGGVNLGKMLDVSADRQGDMTYLKNKTQELKAAMEVSKKILENMNNKPVTQVWYEYKE